MNSSPMSLRYFRRSERGYFCGELRKAKDNPLGSECCAKLRNRPFFPLKNISHFFVLLRVILDRILRYYIEIDVDYSSKLEVRTIVCGIFISVHEEKPGWIMISREIGCRTCRYVDGNSGSSSISRRMVDSD